MPQRYENTVTWKTSYGWRDALDGSAFLVLMLTILVGGLAL